MNRYELADALMYIAEMLAKVSANKTQLGLCEIEELDSAHDSIENVALTILAEEQLVDGSN